LEGGFKVFNSKQEGVDVVLFVTCSVRQHAEDRVWSEIGRFSKLKPKPIIGLVGCMAENYRGNAFKRIPGIDLVVGTNNIGEIPKLLKEILNDGRWRRDEGRILAVGKAKRDEVVYQHVFKQDKKHSFVVISEGCDNFCSYCIVPYVRGRLRHRPPETILKEIETGIACGVHSLTLLGQNVCAYDAGLGFIRLLELVDKIKGLKEFGFVTSHPKDASVGLFQAMAHLEKLKKYLHLPFQSGSNRILELMRRGYSRQHYLNLVNSYQRIVSGGVLTTDIIVGFPGETEEDFKETLGLVREARFESAYIFKYSPRPNTLAGKLKDDVPIKEKQRRHQILLGLQKQISNELKHKK
jgi:tRNA-2-methylthio-N6-dimethylallyladenosine synthase